MPRRVRSNSGVPSSSSRARICRLKGGCATCKRSAARPTLPSSATATKYRIWDRLTPGSVTARAEESNQIETVLDVLCRDAARKAEWRSKS